VHFILDARVVDRAWGGEVVFLSGFWHVLAVAWLTLAPPSGFQRLKNLNI